MLGKFFQWDEFVTPSLVRIFYWLNIVLVALGVLSGIGTAFTMMASYSLFGGFIMLIFVLVLGIVGIIVARMIAEMITIAFRMEEHLRAVRIRWEA